MSGSPGAIDAGNATADDGSGWRRFTATLVLTTSALLAVLVGFLLAVDPYATGRLSLIRSRALQDQLPFTAHANRARDPRFDAAIIGNSHVQQLSPERLDALTGLAFVSLTIPASTAVDQLDVLRWFMANRGAAPRAVVIGMDEHWCLSAPVHSPSFPAWLYTADLLTYVAGLVRYRNFEVAAARIAHLRSGRPGIRPDGYWDYTPFQNAVGLGDREGSHRRLAVPRGFPTNLSGGFPALDRLQTALGRLPAETAVLLLRPPVYRTALPDPATPAGRTAAACGARMAAVASARPRTGLLDLFRPGPMADDPDSYHDHDHYRTATAVLIEADLAAALAPLRVGVPPRSAEAVD